MLGKLAWWHNHIWSSEETWLRSAAFWEIEFGKVFDFGSIADWDRWLTHLANITQSEPEGENALLYHYAVRTESIWKVHTYRVTHDSSRYTGL